MMNQNANNGQAQAMTLAAAIAALTEAITALTTAATTEATATTAETTATTETTSTAAEATTVETTTTTTAPIIVIDDDDNVIATTGDLPCPPEATEFKGSMIEDEPMDPITYEENAAAAAETAAEETLDNIICDISALYDIADYTLGNEGYNVSIDNSPYAPENKVASIDNYKVYISKEIIKAETITGEFRMIVSEKNSGVKILDHSLKIIDNTIKVFSSENTVRIEKLKESKKLMRFMELVDEVSALVMSKYISK